MREANCNCSDNQERAMLTEMLAPEDIQNFLKRLSAAIELDQVNVDALPPERFSIAYSDSMWRKWRHDHRMFIEKLLLTADAIPPVMLKQLTGIATGYEPAFVGSVVLELFAEIVSGSCAEDFGTAERFLWPAHHADDRAAQRQLPPRRRSSFDFAVAARRGSAAYRSRS